MAKKNATGAAIKVAETNGKPKTETSENAVTPNMFDVTIEGIGGGAKWRLTLTANDSHPTESGVQFMSTVRGELSDVDAAISQAIADLCDDDETE